MCHNIQPKTIYSSDASSDTSKSCWSGAEESHTDTGRASSDRTQGLPRFEMTALTTTPPRSVPNRQDPKGDELSFLIKDVSSK